MSLLSSLLSPVYTPKSNLTATTNPTVNDDITKGYQTGSQWFNQSTTEIYVCISNTQGAAVWEQTSLTIDDLGSMALQNANVVAITGGTINGTPIGETTPTTGSFTTLTASTKIKASGSGGFTLQDSSNNVIATIGSGGANLSFNQLINGYLAVNSSGAVTSNIAPNAQTGTTYTLAATDNGKLITFNNASAITVTLPQQSTLATLAGFFCRIRNIGTGTVTFVKEGAETLDGNTTLITNAEALIERPTTTKWTASYGTAIVNMPAIPFFISLPANNTPVSYYISSPMTILGVRELARALTIAGTFAVKLNGTNITGLSAVVPTTAGSYTAATALNTAVRGDILTITYTGTTAVLDHTISIDFTQTF